MPPCCCNAHCRRVQSLRRCVVRYSHITVPGTRRKSPLVTMGAQHSPPKLLFPWTDQLPHPWTHRTYHPKPHPYPISRFATMHRTDRQTDTETNRWLEGNVDDYTLLSTVLEPIWYHPHIGLFAILKCILSVVSQKGMTSHTVTCCTALSCYYAQDAGI